MSADLNFVWIAIIIGLALAFVSMMRVSQLTGRVDGLESKNVGGQAPVAVPKVAVQPVQSAPAVEAGIEEETVAAIMAAISCMAGTSEGVQYAVKSISRATANARPAWGFAGMQQNTRPF